MPISEDRKRKFYCRAQSVCAPLLPKFGLSSEAETWLLLLYSNLYTNYCTRLFQDCLQVFSDSYLLKLTKLPCSQYGLPCLSERGKCNSFPTKSCRWMMFCLLCEDCSDASCSASLLLVHTSWREKMLDANTADAALVSRSIIIASIVERNTGQKLWTKFDDILLDGTSHWVIFCLGVP